LAILLALEVPLSRILRLFNENKNDIFRKEWFYKIGSSKYQNTGIMEICRTILTEQGFEDPDSVTLDQIHLRVCVLSYDIDHSRVLTLSNLPLQPDIDTRKARVIDAILSTSAAPTYFPMCSWKLVVDGKEESFNCVDGGIWGNDPSLYSLIMRRFTDQDPNKIHNVICFGTGIYSRETHRSGEWYSTVGWLAGNPNLIDVILTASSSMIETMMSSFTELKMARYMKLQVKMSQDIKLDDTSSMTRQEQEAENMDVGQVRECINRTLYMGTNVRNIVNDPKILEIMPPHYKEKLDDECIDYLMNLNPKAVKYYIGDFPDRIQKKFVDMFPPEVVRLYSGESKKSLLN